MVTIAWDVDDILNDLMRCWLTQKWLPQHPDCGVCFEQITENTPERIINGTKEEYLLSLDDFRLSKAYLEINPNPEILAWFENFGDKTRHIALTSVPIKTAHVSANWVMKNFGKWIRTFSFVPSLRSSVQDPEYDRNKADYLKWVNKIDILVEDSGKNISEAEKIGVKGVLVGKPWNKSKLLVRDALAKINRIIKEGK